MSKSKKQSTEDGPAETLAVTAGSALLAQLEADLRSIKDAANEGAAGYPPAGYEQLAAGSDSLRIADECYHAGFDAMETAIRNWIYDQRQGKETDPAMNAARKLVALARAAWELADGTEGTVDKDENGDPYLRVPEDLHKALCDRLDALDTLHMNKDQDPSVTHATDNLHRGALSVAIVRPLRVPSTVCHHCGKQVRVRPERGDWLNAVEMVKHGDCRGGYSEVKTDEIIWPNAVVRGDPTLKPSIQPDRDAQGRSL